MDDSAGATDSVEPLELLSLEIRPEWIDYNDHLNVGYYVVAFDLATDAMLDRIGLDEAYRARTGCTTFVLETHVTYERELRLGDPVRITLQLIDHDEKRIHYFLRMLRRDDGSLAATTELILMHMDTVAGRPAPMPPEVRARIAALAERHAALARPQQLGRTIGIRRR